MLRTQGQAVLLDIFYPETGLDPAAVSALGGNIFSVGVSSLPYSTELVQQRESREEEYYPWFGNYSFFVNNDTHRMSDSHWEVMLQLDPAFSGELYIDLSMNFYCDDISGPTVLACDNKYSMGTCQPRHSPYHILIPTPLSNEAPNDNDAVVMYPAFSTTGQGETYTMLSNFYSSTLDNMRDISVYVPSSLIENPISRKVNAIVMLDGDVDTCSLFAYQGGFDATVLNGGLPELIMIGVPPAYNGTACPNPGKDMCSQRYYELTPTPCDSKVSDCNQNQNSGGANLLLNFIWDEIIPSVYKELEIQQGEISIAGYSLGGLTACYAASIMPKNFERAFCLSPSVWWNSGELANIIKSNFETLGAKPTSVVMSVGTQEGPSIMSMNHDQQPWTVYINDTISAWKAIGMEGNSNELIYYTTTGGVHNLISWVDTVSYGMSLLYQRAFPSTFVKSGVRTSIIFPVPSVNCDVNSNESDNANTLIYFAVLLAICLLLLPANLIYFMEKMVYSRENSYSLLSKEQDEYEK